MTKVVTSITEVYDLHTQVGKMGVIGIKTPSMLAIGNAYRGLLANFKNIKFIKCDVRLACASTLPVDPLQVGFEAGQQIDPRSMFDPILYKAVSNRSMGAIVSSIYNHASSGVLDGDSVNYVSDSTAMVQGTTFDPFAVYYNFLSTGHFRKAMPQQGLQMSGLQPRVFPVATDYQISAGLSRAGLGDDLSSKYPTAVNEDDGSSEGTLFHATQFSLRSVPMPSIPTAVWYDDSYLSRATNFRDGSSVSTPLENVISSDSAYNAPPVYVGVIITPPARESGSLLYYRMAVKWTIVFSGLRSMCEIANLGKTVDAASRIYYTDYDTQSAAMSLRGESIDVNGTDMEHVMTKVV